MKKDYDNAFIGRVKELAGSHHSLTAIADILELRGSDRITFFHDVNNPVHPLYMAYRDGRRDGDQDVTDSIHDLALGGEYEAAKLLWEKQRFDDIENLKYTLFGL